MALTYAYSGAHRARLAGMVVWSPFLHLAPESRPSIVVAAAGKLLAKVAPGRQMLSVLDEGYMSRDPDVCKEFKEDPLCHDTGTLQGLAGMLERGALLMRKDVKARFAKNMKVLVLHGTADKVTDCAASRKFVEELEVEDKEFRAYEGYYHKSKFRSRVSR